MLLNVTLLCCFYSHGKKTKQYGFLQPPASPSFCPESLVRAYFCRLILSSSCVPDCHCLYFDKVPLSDIYSLSKYILNVRSYCAHSQAL